MTVDLIHGVPSEFAKSVCLDELFQTVSQIHDWEERQASVLDFIYRSRLSELLSTQTETNAIQALSSHLTEVSQSNCAEKLNGLTKPYAHRWLAYRDVLNDLLSTRKNAVPDMVMQRSHVKDILQLLNDRTSLSQKEIENHLQLKEANLSRILSLMERWELVRREKIGRIKQLSLGVRAQEVTATRH